MIHLSNLSDIVVTMYCRKSLKIKILLSFELSNQVTEVNNSISKVFSKSMTSELSKTVSTVFIRLLDQYLGIVQEPRDREEGGQQKFRKRSPIGHAEFQLMEQ